MKAMKSLRAALIVLLFAVFAGPAWARELILQRFDGDYVLGRDGSVDVTERIAIRFIGSWNGVIRAIPVAYHVPGVGNWDIRLDVESVTDDAGAPLRHEETQPGDSVSLKIWVPGASDAVRTVTLRYRLHNALRNVIGLDEFYWNVTGVEWDSGIEAASAVVHLPDGVDAASVRTAAYTGHYGERGSDTQTATPDARTLRLQTTRPLGFREGLTIVVGLPEGVIARPTAAMRARWIVADNIALVLPFLMLALVLALWWWRGRDRLADPVIVPRWEAPDGLRPAQVGVIADDRLDMRDVAATFIDLAVRGHLRIEEQAGKDGRPVSYRLVKLKQEDDPLAPFERTLLSAVDEGHGKPLSLLQSGLALRLPGFHNQVMKSLVAGGYFSTRPDRVRTAWTIVAWLVTVALLAGLVAPRIEKVWYLAAWILCVPWIHVLARHMPRRTKRGLDALAAVRGIEEYVTTAEREKLQNLPPSAFEAVLPYAMALGLEKTWSHKFDGIAVKAPAWYVGAGPNYVFAPSQMITCSQRLATTAGSVARTVSRGWGAPGSYHGGTAYSGSSGFSGGGFAGGGGFSGGGFGGGGGGGF